MQEIAKEGGFTISIQYEPWVRALATGKSTKNMIIMPLVRNPEREKNYIWVQELQKLDVCFITTNGKKYDLESAKKLSKVLIQDGTPWVAFLENAGFKNLEKVSETSVNAKKLSSNRGDAWFVPLIEAQWIWKTEKITATITVGPSITTSTNYLAMAIDSDPVIVNKVSEATKTVLKSGRFEKIINSYK